MLVNKVQGRGGVTQIEMTVCEVIQEMVDNWFFEEDTLTGGVEMLDETTCGINIHEQLQLEFNIKDIQGKYFIGHVDDAFGLITKEEWHDALKQRDYDTCWEVTDEGIMRYMYADGYILIFVYNKRL